MGSVSPPAAAESLHEQLQPRPPRGRVGCIDDTSASVMGFLPKVFDYLFNDMGGIAAVVAHIQSVNALYRGPYQD